MNSNSIKLFLIILLSICPVFANGGDSIVHWGTMIMTLLGGLALFLYGMEKMSEGLKKSAGDKMRTILSTLTNNRFIGLTVGAFVTMMIQSSSATTVMLVSFVQAQLMTFVQSLGCNTWSEYRNNNYSTINSIKIDRLCIAYDRNRISNSYNFQTRYY